MLKYFSVWIQIFHTIWFLLYKNDIKIKYINPYYLNILLLFGYILFMYNELIIKRNKYELSFYIVNSLFHILPLLTICSIGIGEKYALSTAILLFLIYLYYLKLINKNIYEVYLIDRTFKNWDDIKNYFKNY